VFGESKTTLIQELFNVLKLRVVVLLVLDFFFQSTYEFARSTFDGVKL